MGRIFTETVNKEQDFLSTLFIYYNCNTLTKEENATVIWNVITLFRSITMFSGTSNTLWIIPSFKLNMGNIPWNIVGPVEHCYGFEQGVVCLSGATSPPESVCLRGSQIVKGGWGGGGGTDIIVCSSKSRRVIITPQNFFIHGGTMSSIIPHILSMN